MGPTSVRRNLFHHHLGRRPVSTVPSSASGQSSGSAANNGVSGYSSHMSAASTESTSSLSSGPVDNGEIVARGKNGDYKLDIPILPPITGVDDGDEMEGVEDGGVPRGSGAGGVDSTGQTGMGGSGKESTNAMDIDGLWPLPTHVNWIRLLTSPLI
ncbi:hypothetical protein EYZ11_012539 [Aspergillus tanneri]|uniref:Uncharacterized protein n=1 Tax=Aspergillus tanneri TaxID=1220188 RepID=A0A4S3J001_9EURO|nr:hypothetical protein EYZ11_012539 [Aspergillus tanneri]